MILYKFLFSLYVTLCKPLRTLPANLQLASSWFNYFLLLRSNLLLAKSTNNVIALFLIIIFITSCEKNVTVEIPKATEEIVVEGVIETDAVAIVFLSHTLPFFGQINISDILLNSILGATVIVEDGSMTDTLFQITPLYGIYMGSKIHGTPGNKYKLTVIAEDKILHAFTSIPMPVKLDSVWWKPNGNRDSLGFAWAHLSDPDTIGNCYRWYAKRINRYTFGEDIGKIKDSTFIPPPGSVFEDKFINTKSFDLSFPRGKFQFSNKKDDLNDEEFYFKRGDTIVIKFCSIDQSHFEFWRAEETQVQNNGNPFGSPAPLPSNILGGLGFWGGYAPSFDTIIAK